MNVVPADSVDFVSEEAAGFNMFDQVWNEHYIIAQAVCDINNKILTRN